MDSSEPLNTSVIDETDLVIEVTPALVQKRRSQGRIIFDRFLSNRSAIVGAIFLILLIVTCFLGPLITGHNDPNAINVRVRWLEDRSHSSLALARCLSR